MNGGRPIVVVTGGARRVGRAICLALGRAGFDVVFTYRTSAAEAETLVAELSEIGAGAEARRLDLDDCEEAEGFGLRLARESLRLDAIVHNASIYNPTPLDRLTKAEALQHYRINALSPLLLTRAAAPLLKQSELPGGAGVVAMCDIHAMGRPRPRYAAYNMSKASLAEMVRTLARELAPEVRVNGVAPGVVAFPETGEDADPEMQRKYLSRVPLERSGEPGDAAEAVRWLVMDARYTTGQIVRVDGGRWVT
ncbi:MAG: SDR family oxidoreductase [Phycisphaeraceae bacterium]|nr:MAG: SDR family oxidoreductase [Phycisphaeraceae bacterium]